MLSSHLDPRITEICLAPAFIGPAASTDGSMAVVAQGVAFVNQLFVIYKK